MANLKTMYKGVVNSPETYLKEVLTQGATVMYVADGSVFGALPTLATMGDSENAETILVKSKRSDGGYDIQRGFEGTDKKWDKATMVARNFTNYDYQTIIDNLNSLNNGKVEKSGSKILSDNNYTNAAKAKVDAIPANPKYTDTTYDLTPYAKKTDLKTSLSEMTQSSSYRTVSDSEKSTWNNKLSTVSGQDVSRAKAKGYSSASSWASVGSSRDVEDWIGDFDKRTRENKTAISGKVNQSDITDMKKCKILTQSEYNALSSTEKNRADTLYFIKE